MFVYSQDLNSDSTVLHNTVPHSTWRGRATLQEIKTEDCSPTRYKIPSAPAPNLLTPAELELSLLWFTESIDYCITRTPRKLEKQNGVTQARKGEVFYRLRTLETFHIDISGVVMAQGVLPHKNSPTHPSKMSKGRNNSQQVISIWTSSVNEENLKQPQVWLENLFLQQKRSVGSTTLRR